MYGALHFGTDFSSRTTTASIYQSHGNDARFVFPLLAQERHWVGLGCETGGNCWGWSAKSVDPVGKHGFLISIAANTEEHTISGRKQGVTLYLRGIHGPGVSPFAEQFISWTHTAVVAEPSVLGKPKPPRLLFLERLHLPEFLAI